MAKVQRTDIEWCDWSVNPFKLELPNGARVNACIKCAEGCRNCYAESIVNHFWRKAWRADSRIGAFPGYSAALFKLGKPVLDDDALKSVLRLDNRIASGKVPADENVVFWCDMTDMFGGFWPTEFVDKSFAVMALTPRLTHIVLTKRPDRMAKYFTHPHRNTIIDRKALDFHPAVCSARKSSNGWHRSGAGSPIPQDDASGVRIEFDVVQLPLPNVILGTSASTQADADANIPHLLRCPAAYRMVSLEPMLGQLNLHCMHGFCSCDTQKASWLIIGCESRGGRVGRLSSYGDATEADWLGWAEDVADQCKAAGVAMFVKQIPLNGKVCKDMATFPAKLQRREVPERCRP